MVAYNQQLYFSDEKDSGIAIRRHDNREVARVQSLSQGVVRIEVFDASWSAVDSATLTVSSRSSHTRGRLRGDDTRIADGVISLKLGRTAAHLPDSTSAESDNRQRIVSALSISTDRNQGQAGTEDRTLRALRNVEVPSEGIRFPRSAGDSRTPDACRTGIWYFRDAPRVVSPWDTLSEVRNGSSGAPSEDQHWRIDRFAGDWYVFAWGNDPVFLKQEFLRLTGRIPLPPLWMFGVWHSRYFPYTASQVIELVKEYRRRSFPLDAFVIDTDWRKGASRGYRINDELLGDASSLFRECHDHGVRVMFNDHPEHRLRSALDDGLLHYRERNLQRLLNMGLDGWWFDRNWREIFLGPDRGVESSVWGQFLYWEIDSQWRGHGRVPLLSMRTDHPAGHRYPIWWTGDIYSDWDALVEAIEETVDSGTQLLPYTGQDIGGHIGFPSPEQYVRWIQWAAVSPTFRLHCGPRNRMREPWKFGAHVETIALQYTQLRMRLIPLLYSAARQATESGTPLLRDAALSEPEFAQRQRSQDASALGDQFFLGDDLWIAPVYAPCAGVAAPAPAGADDMDNDDRDTVDRDTVDRKTADSIEGANEWASDFHQLEGHFVREVFAPSDPFQGVNPTSEFEPASDSRRIERSETYEVRLSPTWASRDRGNWGNDFFVRWSGSFTVSRDGWYRFVLTGSGTKQLRIGDAPDDHNAPPHVLSKFDKGRNEVNVRLSTGREYPLEVCYHQRGPGITSCYLSCRRLLAPEKLGYARRTVSLPPGEWVRLGTGERYIGPQQLRIPVSLAELPAFLKDSSIVPLAASAPNTRALDWSALTLHIRPPLYSGETVERTLFADNGETGPFAEEDAVCCTIAVTRVEEYVIHIEARSSRAVREGGENLDKAPSRDRSSAGRASGNDTLDSAFAHFVVLLHLQPGETVESLTSGIDGASVDYTLPGFEEDSRVPLAHDGALAPDAQSVRFALGGLRERSSGEDGSKVAKDSVAIAIKGESSAQ